MAGENKGKKRKYLPHGKKAVRKGPYPLRPGPGVQGFFITCDGGRERQAANEALNLLDTFYEELVHGKNSGIRCRTSPSKPLNKIIKFKDSDSSGDEDECEDELGTEKLKNENCDSLSKKQRLEPDTSKGETTDPDPEREEADVEKHADGNATNQIPEKQHLEPDTSKGETTGPDPEREEADVEKHADGNATNQIPEKQHLEPDTSKGETTGPDPEREEADVEKHADGNAINQIPEFDGSRCDMKDPDKSDKSEDKDIDDLIEDELKELGDRGKRRFASLDPGCNGCIFIQMHKRVGDPSPAAIVQNMMASAASTRKHMSRFILRAVPAEVTCYASEEEISKAIKPLIAQHFPTEGSSPQKFAVLYEARSNTGIERMPVINAVAKSVPQPHKVDLKNPDKTIIVQIAKTICMIGVVERYKEFAKFNLRQLTSPQEPQQ